MDTMSALVSVEPEVTVGARRRSRRTWSDEEKRRLVALTYEAGTSVSIVARRYDLNANLLFTWRREARRAEVVAGTAEGSATLTFAPIELIADQGAPSCASPEGRIVIELPGGARVCIDGAVSEVALVRVLQALRVAS